MRSRIYAQDRVDNTERKFGSAQAYYPAVLHTEGVAGDIPMLFTGQQIDEAMERAAKNPEDVPKPKTWLEKLVAWFN